MNTVVTCNNEIDSHFDSKFESATRGLRPDANRYLQSISIPNALVIIDYITSMRTEINLSDNYSRDLIILCKRCYFIVSFDIIDVIEWHGYS